MKFKREKIKISCGGFTNLVDHFASNLRSLRKGNETKIESNFVNHSYNSQNQEVGIKQVSTQPNLIRL